MAKKKNNTNDVAVDVIIEATQEPAVPNATKAEQQADAPMRVGKRYKGSAFINEHGDMFFRKYREKAKNDSDIPDTPSAMIASSDDGTLYEYKDKYKVVIEIPKNTKVNWMIISTKVAKFLKYSKDFIPQ